MYLYCCGRLQGRNYPESAEQSAPPPLRLLCQTVTVTHRIPRNTRKPQQRSVMPENRPITVHTSVHHSLLISNSLLSLYRLTFPVLSWFPTTGTYSAFNNLRKPKKNHRADNTWRNTAVITERSGDIFPDGSRHAIVKLVHCQFCQPVIDRRVEGFQLRRGKVITCVGNHFFQCLPG